MCAVSHHQDPAVAMGKCLAKFCDSNGKLGKGLISFDMSPSVSCPGSKHAICRELRPDGNADPKPICWACRKGYRQEKMKDRLAANLQFSRTDVVRPVGERRDRAGGARSRQCGCRASATCITSSSSARCAAIVQANPKMRFWFYTRSWAVPGSGRN